MRHEAVCIKNAIFYSAGLELLSGIAVRVAAKSVHTLVRRGQSSSYFTARPSAQVQQIYQCDTLLGLHHIKRVKPSDIKGQLLVLLCVFDRRTPASSGGLATVNTTTSTAPHAPATTEAPPTFDDLPAELHGCVSPLADGQLVWVQVPRHAPVTRPQASEWSQHWPVSLKALPPPTPASLLSQEDAQHALNTLRTLHQRTTASSNCSNAACIIDPATGRCCSTHDCIHNSLFTLYKN